MTSTTLVSMISGAAPGVVHAHRDHREVHVRQLADAHARGRDSAEQDQRRHQHPGEDGAANGDFGKHHGAGSSRRGRAADDRRFQDEIVELRGIVRTIQRPLILLKCRQRLQHVQVGDETQPVVAPLGFVVLARGLRRLFQCIQLRPVEHDDLINRADLLFRLAAHLARIQLGLRALRHRLAHLGLQQAAGIDRHRQRNLHVPVRVPEISGVPQITGPFQVAVGIQIERRKIGASGHRRVLLCRRQSLLTCLHVRTHLQPRQIFIERLKVHRKVLGIAQQGRGCQPAEKRERLARRAELASQLFHLGAQGADGALDGQHLTDPRAADAHPPVEFLFTIDILVDFLAVVFQILLDRQYNVKILHHVLEKLRARIAVVLVLRVQQGIRLAQGGKIAEAAKQRLRRRQFGQRRPIGRCWIAGIDRGDGIPTRVRGNAAHGGTKRGIRLFVSFFRLADQFALGGDHLAAFQRCGIIFIQCQRFRGMGGIGCGNQHAHERDGQDHRYGGIRFHP